MYLAGPLVEPAAIWQEERHKVDLSESKKEPELTEA